MKITFWLNILISLIFWSNISFSNCRSRAKRNIYFFLFLIVITLSILKFQTHFVYHFSLIKFFDRFYSIQSIKLLQLFFELFAEQVICWFPCSLFFIITFPSYFVINSISFYVYKYLYFLLDCNTLCDQGYERLYTESF